MLMRQAKRLEIVKRYAKKRADLKQTIRDPKASEDEKLAAQRRLQTFPRDANPVRLRSRCAITGRPRGFYQKFGIGRNKLREATMNGEIPGLRKASW